MNILVIGGGNMGYTYAEGMSKSALLNNEKIKIMDASEDTRLNLDKHIHFEIYSSLENCLPLADIIFIAVKPYHSEALFKEMKPYLNEEQIIVSLMAGVTMQTIHDGLEINKIVRAMPNLPAKVGKGLTSFTASDTVSRVELMTVKNLLDTTGESIHVNTEKEIDASTGISGSGPAYVFYFMQSMMEAAKQMGFSPEDSKILVSQTFEGAIKLFNESNLSPQSWMDKVASKGGTTEAALDSMEDNNVNELIKEAAFSAFERAVELSKEY